MEKTIRILTPAPVFSDTAADKAPLTVLPASTQVRAVCAKGKWLKIEAQAGDRKVSGFIEAAHTNWQP